MVCNLGVGAGAGPKFTGSGSKTVPPRQCCGAGFRAESRGSRMILPGAGAGAVTKGRIIYGSGSG